MKLTAAAATTILYSIGVVMGAAADSKTAKPTTPVVQNINDRASHQSTQSSEKESNDTESETEVETETEVYTIEIPERCAKDHYVIHSQSDLDALSDLCSDLIGSIVINNYYSPVIDTGNIQTVGGSIVVSNATNLVRINFPNMAVISGTFQLSELTALTAVNAPVLNTVTNIDWRVLPILSTINFESGIIDVKSITISDTSLVGFAGFDVDTLETLNINNNRFMESISSNLKGINEKLSISANARTSTVSFPNLEHANNVTIRDVASLSMLSIEEVNESLELINNNFQSVKFPNLKNVGGTLSLIENFNLKDIEFPQVEEVGGGLMIVNNTQLSKINFLPKLKTVGGALTFTGDFKEAVFSKLNLVRGSAHIITLAESFDCARWIHGNDMSTSSVIRGGQIQCNTGNKQQVVKYDQDGTIVEEEISYNDPIDSNKTKQNGAGSSTAGFGQAVLAVGSVLLWLVL